MIYEFVNLIPAELLDYSGKVFVSGRTAFGSPSDLYILGLNPGGAPENNVQETVRTHTHKVLHEVPDDWCALTDEAWGRNGHRLQHPMQRNLLHLMKSLGLDHRRIPASDLVFARSQDASKIGKKDLDRFANLCWPFHRAVIERLGVGVILCLGREAVERVKACIKADNPSAGEFEVVDSFVEDGGLKVESRTYRNRHGLSVVQLAHPSRFHWTSPRSDPSGLVQRALEGYGTGANCRTRTA